MFEDHWGKDLEIWFKEGVDTPGRVRIKCWDGMKGEGELQIG